MTGSSVKHKEERVARGICFWKPNPGGELNVFLICEKNYWRPPGGHCENGESPREAVMREILEETGIEVRVSTQIFMYRSEGKRKTVNEYFFLVQPVGGRLRQADTKQGKSPDWFSVARLPRRLIWHYRDKIERARKVLEMR